MKEKDLEFRAGGKRNQFSNKNQNGFKGEGVWLVEAHSSSAPQAGWR